MKAQNDTIRTVKMICILAAIMLPAVVLVHGAFMLFDIVLDPYYDKCHELAMKFNGVSTVGCLEYMEEQPDVTGQEVLDYYGVEAITATERLLTEPLSP